MILRHILAVDNDGPVCTDCAKALGGTPRDPIVSVYARVCGHCGRIGECTAVDAYDWPASLIRPELYGATRRTAPEAPQSHAGSTPSSEAAEQRAASHAPPGVQTGAIPEEW